MFGNSPGKSFSLIIVFVAVFSAFLTHFSVSRPTVAQSETPGQITLPTEAAPTQAESPLMFSQPSPKPVEPTSADPSAVDMQVEVLEVPVGQNSERVSVVRLNPARVNFRVLYNANTPQSVQLWAQQNRAILAVNAGYYEKNFTTTGFLVSNGVAHGRSYGDSAGMFALTEGGAASVRWFGVQPFDMEEPFREAVQSFPMLVRPGGVAYTSGGAAAARRTVVAQDRDGHILFIIADRGFFTLRGMAAWLANSHLNIETALNLDGGHSTGLWMPDGPIQIDSGSVPSVIVVDRK